MSGERLCLLMNAIVAGSIPKISTSRFAFKRIENIWKFTNACKVIIGMPESMLFSASDFYEGRATNACVSTLHLLGGWLQTYPEAAPDFRGPYIGKRVSRPNTRSFSEAQKTEQRRAAYEGGITAGSSTTMARVGADTGHQITFGAGAVSPRSAAIRPPNSSRTSVAWSYTTTSLPSAARDRYARVASSLTRGALSGITITAGIPTIDAASATACAWLPLE